MRRPQVLACATFLMLTAAYGAREVLAAATEAQKQQIAEVEQSLKQLPALLKEKKFEQVSEVLAASQTLLSDLAESEAKDDPAVATL
ncbi:MAG TPA: hypothetical protein VHB99_19660, partial [Pirellulales bacterium]|nr:hypothetical protein [Pirellulales bacterium]